MTGGEFIDTNVIVYADDASEPAKQAKAADLFARLRRTRRGVVSIQVLQETLPTHAPSG
jgi:predicted nucleic acid-binding protein